MLKAALTTIKSAIPDEVAQAAKKRVNQWKGIGDDEALVRDATNAEPWGPHGEQLRAIARLTRDGKWDVVREVLEKRLAERAGGVATRVQGAHRRRVSRRERRSSDRGGRQAKADDGRRAEVRVQGRAREG